MSSTSLALLRFLVLDLVLDVLQFPMWWYTRGLGRAVRWYVEQLGDGLDRLAIVVLLKNLGRPMFGDYSREGRAISFAVRIVQLVVSFILYLFWVIVMTGLLLSYVLLIPAALALTVYLWPYG